MSIADSIHRAQTFENALKELVGLSLSSVEFVQDYLQLRFDGPVLTAYIPPTIHIPSARLTRGDPGYADSICGLIGRAVIRTAVADLSVVIEFDEAFVVRISLKDEDYIAAEAIEFRTSKGARWVI